MISDIMVTPNDNPNNPKQDRALSKKGSYGFK